MQRHHFALVLAIVLLPWETAQAASEQACNDYAQRAVEQYHRARDRGLPTPHPVWSADYHHHYDWCLGQQEAALARGTSERERALDAGAPAPPPMLEAQPQLLPIPVLPSQPPSPTPPPLSTLQTGRPPVPPATGPGLAVVEQLVEGFDQTGEVWLQCPAGKVGVGWGFAHNKNPLQFKIIEAQPWTDPGLWRLSWGVDPVYAQAIPGDVGGVDARRTYHLWLYLMCVDAGGPVTRIRQPDVRNYPPDCASLPACTVWGQ